MTAEIFSVIYKVYIEDTDAMGIMYHANYLRFLERARTELLQEKGASLKQLAKENIHFAISEVGLQFLSPAYLEDQLTILSKIIKRTACSLVFEQSIKNQDNKELCKATIKVVCVNEAMKPRTILLKL